MCPIHNQLTSALPCCLSSKDICQFSRVNLRCRSLKGLDAVIAEALPGCVFVNSGKG